MAFLQIPRAYAGKKLLPKKNFLRTREKVWNFILHPTSLRKGMRDTKMARWQLKMAFFANPSHVGGRAGKAKRRTFLPARPRMWDFDFSLAILPSCHLKAFFDILRQINENVKRRRKRMAILFVVYTVWRVWRVQNNNCWLMLSIAVW